MAAPIRVPARPQPFLLDPDRAGVLVVDMQNDFGSEGGMFHRAGIDVSSIQATVAPTARVLASARDAGMRVFYLAMGYCEDLSDLGPPDAPNRLAHMRLGVGDTVTAPDGRVGRVLVHGSWGTEIVGPLSPRPGDEVIRKTRFSGFYGTDLEARLRGHGIRQLVVTGCTTSVCVGSTVRDAMFRDLSCLVLADCCAEPIGEGAPRSNHEASLLTIEVLMGWVSTSDDFLSALGKGHGAHRS